MTGEVTLQGRVLPIGGVKQKVLAAHRAGLTDVVLPARNGPDLEDVPESVREEMTFHLAESVADVLAVAVEVPTAASGELPGRRVHRGARPGGRGLTFTPRSPTARAAARSGSHVQRCPFPTATYPHR